MASSDFKKFLHNTVKVRRLELVDDGMGGSKETWIKITDELKCRLDEKEGEMWVRDIGQYRPINSKMLCDYNDDVRIGDKVITPCGNNYTVVKKEIAYKITRPHHMTIKLRRLGDAGTQQNTGSC